MTMFGENACTTVPLAFYDLRLLIIPTQCSHGTITTRRGMAREQA